MRDSPQARTSSRTLRTSRSVALRTADAGSETTAIVWPLAAKYLELVALRHVGTRRIVLTYRSKYQVVPRVYAWPLWAFLPQTYFVIDTKRSTGPAEYASPPPTCQ